MIPVGMGYKYFGGYGSVLNIIPHQAMSQRMDTGSGIDDDESVFFAKPKLQAWSVASEFHCLRSRTSNRAADTPETKFHNFLLNRRSSKIFGRFLSLARLHR